MLLAETLVLGDNLLAYMLLAFGGALAVGNTLAIVRPPERPKQKGDLERAPLIRSVVFAVLGTFVALWAAASLLS
jgi:hypothetical protein